MNMANNIENIVFNFSREYSVGPRDPSTRVATFAFSEGLLKFWEVVRINRDSGQLLPKSAIDRRDLFSF